MQDAEHGRGRPADDNDLAEIDLGLLLALEALLRERNVTRAASRLNIGQPALSARLNRLRQIFADPLFVPAASGRGVVPTTRAVELQTALADVLGKLRRMVEGPAEFDPLPSTRIRP
ncbi:LysR family transcriptional regulator [Bradyrhizobium yuanmingense]|uniref:LysR family transcriptional regulator n=1 Tax=Bradyrhizobium yuanmingense TaxID=108015 RepID=UPI001FD42480|nr:LysR family transcriptional regulator [Bradyrhizobium yuanmingense]